MLLLSLDVLLYHLEIPKASLYIQLNISSKLAFEMKRQMNTKLTQQVPILQRLWVLLAFLTSRFNRRFWHLQVKQKSQKAKIARHFTETRHLGKMSRGTTPPPHMARYHITSQKENPTFRPTPTNPDQNPNLFIFTCLHMGLDFGSSPSKTEWSFGFW